MLVMFPDDYVELKSGSEDALGSYGISILDMNATKFRVQACQSISAIISVSPNNFETLAIEVVIGHDDNSGIIVRNGVAGDIVAEKKETGLLHCEYFRTFWITLINHRFVQYH